MYGYGYPGCGDCFGGSWLWIIIVVLIIFFVLFWGCGSQSHLDRNNCCI